MRTENKLLLALKQLQIYSDNKEIIVDGVTLNIAKEIRAAENAPVPPKDLWQFVELYYPNYGGCNEIAESDDLEKVKNREWDEDDYAHRLYKEIVNESEREYLSEELKEQYVDDEIERRINESNAYIFERAIEGYIESLNS